MRRKRGTKERSVHPAFDGGDDEDALGDGIVFWDDLVVSGTAMDEQTLVGRGGRQIDARPVESQSAGTRTWTRADRRSLMRLSMSSPSLRT